MATNFTVSQILAMAPDAASVGAGRGLAVPRKWGQVGANDSVVWGECQGSGALPYQTRIDLTDIAFKCTCPSRKFPCKHSLALFLLLVEHPAIFTATEPPGWVNEWMESRKTKADKKEAKKSADSKSDSSDSTTEKSVDAVAQAKRAGDRQIKVASGITELDRFLQDAMRQGLAWLQQQPYSFWESIAARLVDAQVPGLARAVRQCSGIPNSGEGWQDSLLEKLSRLYLLVEAYGRLQTLPENLQEDIRSLVGFTTNQDELLKQDGIFDTWEIVGQYIEQEDKLKVQRTWLYGKTNNRTAMVLNFAHGTAPLDQSLIAGRTLEAELVFFPGAFPLRALVKTKSEKSAPLTQLSGCRLPDALDAYSQALACNPWLDRFPLRLSEVVPVYDDGWLARDRQDHLLPLSLPESLGWKLLAISAGHPVSMFGEFNGSTLAPLAVTDANNTYYRLA